MRLRNTISALILVSILLLVAISTLLALKKTDDHARRTGTQTKMRLILKQVQLHQATSDRVIEKLALVVEPEKSLDSWGRPIIYEVTKTMPQTVILRSHGANLGITNDDIVVVGPMRSL